MAVSLESGSLISHYRVLSPLGSGGMGEVYVAHDNTLERSIALKILPPELVANEERVRRFVQEAKSASSLSHPNIVTIHEIGRAEVEHPDTAGEKIDSGPIYYIAMELIDGDTLRTKIHREKTDLKKILGYLTQAAEGLAKAHAAGIIHRDLKPDNIMITKDGYAKVLDFGLAKLQTRGGGGGETPDGATAVKEQTREGVVLGTIGYMSPEQVQGQPADHRSDIFSFGCMLYEAAARMRPFTGESDVDVMHKILHDKPEALDESHPEVPAELRRIIRRCLAKDPEKRYQSMKDLALELGELVEEYDELSRAGDSRSNSSISAPALALEMKRRPFVTLGIVAAVVAVLGGVAFVGWKLAGRQVKVTSGSFSSMTMTRLTSSGDVVLGAISPDGRYVAHVVEDRGLQGLSVRQVATGADIQVVPPAPMEFQGVTFSPDGNYLDYVRRESEGSIYSVLYQIPSLGGTPRKLIFDVDTAITFSPDGSRIAFVRGYPHIRESAVVVANADGTGEKKLAIRKQPNFFLINQASWSPDGKTIAVIGTGVDGGEHADVVIVDTTSGEEHVVGTSRWSDLRGVAWLPDGLGIAVTGRDKVDAASSQVWLISYPSGEVRKITNDLNSYASVSTTSDGKTIATIQASRYGNLWSVSVDDPASPKQRTSGTQEAINGVATMPDGSIVFEAFANGVSNIWSLDATGSRKQITFDQNQNFDPSVSADGKTIVFGSLRDGTPHVMKMDANGGNPVALTSGKGEFSGKISSDGTWVAYKSVDGGLWRISSSGGTPQRLVEAAAGNTISISPDGSMLNYSTYEVGQDRARNVEIVIPSGGGSPIRTFPLEGSFANQWSPAGDALDYRLNTQGVSNIWRQPLDGSPPKQLTKFDDGTIDWFAWAADGKTLVIARGERISDVVLIGNFK